MGGRSTALVDVRWADLGVPAAAAAWLTAAERARWCAGRREEDRSRFLGAHVLGRVVAAAQIGREPAGVVLRQRCQRCGGPHGRPEVVGAGVFLSLAHAGSVVIAAVAPVPVGVDVESADPGPGAVSAIADTALGPAEHAELDRVAPAARDVWLLRRWVSKEAVAKARGIGFTVAPAAVDTGDHHVVALDLEDEYVAAVAVRGRARPRVDVVRYDWAELTAAVAAPAPTATPTAGR